MIWAGVRFDISIFWKSATGVFEVKSTNGDTFLGGEDFDMRLVNYLADEFQKEQGIDLRRDKLALAAAQGSRGESQDRTLLDDGRPEINLPFISPPTRLARKHMTMKLTRAKIRGAGG